MRERPRIQSGITWQGSRDTAFRVLPPFTEGLLRLPHHGTPQLQLYIVVSGIGPIHGIGSHALPITTVIDVVAAAVVEVDAPEERHILLGTTGMADDDHLLMVAAERKHPLIQQHLTARPVDGEGEHPVRTHLRAHHTGVGAPEQPAPVPDRPLTGLPDPESRSRQRQQLLTVRCPNHRRTDTSPDRSRQIDLRAIHVEHLPQPDHRNTVRAAVREIDEHPWVVPPIIPEEHPPHGRHSVREMSNSGKLPRSTETARTSRGMARGMASIERRSRRLVVRSARSRPTRRRSDPHRSTPSTSKNHAMGVAARHRQTPAVTRSTFGVWRRARARGWRSDHSIDAPASASAAISAKAMVMPRASVIFVAADSTRGAPVIGATATRTS